MYLQKVGSSRQKIASVASPFIRDGTVSHAPEQRVHLTMSWLFQTVLIHSSSRVVLTLLKKATENRSRLRIFITASDGSGLSFYQ